MNWTAEQPAQTTWLGAYCVDTTQMDPNYKHCVYCGKGLQPRIAVPVKTPEVLITASVSALEGLRAELQAAHSDISYACGAVFSMLEALREKEMALAAERNKVLKLEETVSALKATIQKMKERIGAFQASL